MLILDKNKENLLVSQYGFKEDSKYKLYEFGKSLIIYSAEHPKWSCRIDIRSVSRKFEDKMYELIKDDVLIVVPNETKVEKIEKLKTKIRELEAKIENLENIKKESK